MFSRTPISALTLTLLLAAPHLRADENDWFIKLDQPPAKAPQKTVESAAGAVSEDFPVPPSIPTRQTERKQPPEPDYLMSKVIWGEAATFTGSSGSKLPIADWNLVDNDLEKLAERAKEIGQGYQWSNANLNTFSHDPRRMPSIIFSGVRSLRLDAKQLEKLRNYVLNGGTIILDSVYGSPYFYDSAKSIFEGAFPEEHFRVLPADHPLFHIHHDIIAADYGHDKLDKTPFLEAIYVGCRAGVILSKNGLGTGWAGDQKVMAALEKKGLEPRYFLPETAQKIATNIAAYVVGYADAGVLEGTPEIFGLPDENRPTDELVFAQIRHGGAWNVHPGAASTLMMQMRKRTAVRNNLKRVVVDLAKDDISNFPFLYLTGLDAFEFSPQERASLREFIASGGKLLVNNGLGLSTFDASVRENLAKILPGTELKTLPPDHDIFQALAPVTSVRYSPSLVKSDPELGNRPHLEGITVGDDLRIIYSPHDIEAGWQDTYYPLMRGYERPSAMELGMNIITYIMTN